MKIVVVDAFHHPRAEAALVKEAQFRRGAEHLDSGLIAFLPQFLNGFHFADGAVIAFQSACLPLDDDVFHCLAHKTVGNHAYHQKQEEV